MRVANLCVVIVLAAAFQTVAAGSGIQARPTGLVEPGLLPSPAESPRAMTPRGLDNLMAFAHLFGVVRHFAPTEAVRTTNWDEFARRGVRSVERARSPAELAAKLLAIFSPIAPNVRVWVTSGERPSDAEGLTTVSSVGITTWINTGIASEGCDDRASFRSELVVRPASGGEPRGAPAPFRPWSGSLGGDVSAAVPVAQWVALPVDLAMRCRPVQPAGPTEAASLGDRATRVGGIVTAWNVLRHSYPYLDIVDWTGALRSALAASGTDAMPGDYLITLERLVADLNDGQAHALSPIPEAQTAYLPVSFDWVEEQLVVSGVAGGQSVIRRGDVVLTLDAVPTEHALANRERTFPGATPQRRRYRTVNSLAVGPVGTGVTLGLRSASGGADREVRLFYERARPESSGPDRLAELKSGIVYVDLSRTTANDFIAALPTLSAAQGIVFDLRADPLLSAQDILPWLSASELHVQLASRTGANGLSEAGIPQTSRPFLEEADWFVPPAAVLAPRSPYLAAKVAFLTGPGAIGRAETILSVVKQNNLGEIVGAATAGTNGELNSVSIPGGFTIRFTAFRVTMADGSPYQGVGILPTLPVSRTLSGVVAGRDEVLEKGIAVVSGTQTQR